MDESINFFDVLIIGAGMVGTSLALALKPMPLKVGIVESKSVKDQSLLLDADSRPLALTYASACVLNKLNLWSELEKHAIPIHSVHISDRKHFGITRIQASQEKLPALGYVIPVSILSAELYQALLQSDHLFSPAKIQSLTRVQSHWQVTLKTEKGIRQVNARLIVAADGTNSDVRKLLDMPAQVHDYQQQAMISTITLARSHNNIAYERFTDQGVLAFLPLKGNRAGLVWTAQQQIISALEQLEDRELLQRLQHYFGYRLGKFLAIDKRHLYPLKRLNILEQIQEGLVFLGNAAHTLHPIAAQGFNLGLMDAVGLAEMIATVTDDVHQLSELRFLQQYLKQRLPLQRRTARFTHTLTSLFSSNFLPLVFGRNMALLALNTLPGLKHALARRLGAVSV